MLRERPSDAPEYLGEPKNDEPIFDTNRSIWKTHAILPFDAGETQRQGNGMHHPATWTIRDRKHNPRFSSSAYASSLRPLSW